MCLKFEMCCYSGALHYQFGSHKAIYKINISLKKKLFWLRHSIMSLENCQCLIISISVDQLDVIITTNMFKTLDCNSYM